jgi:hypothetical protein
MYIQHGRRSKDVGTISGIIGSVSIAVNADNDVSGAEDDDGTPTIGPEDVDAPRPLCKDSATAPGKSGAETALLWPLDCIESRPGCPLQPVFMSSGFAALGSSCQEYCSV